MDYLLNQPWLFGLLVTLVLAGAFELGRLTAIHYLLHEDKDHREHIIGVGDGIFVLVYLMLGFTLAQTVPHLNERRALLIDEGISISTMYRNAATLPQPYRDHSRALLKQYVDARLDLDNVANDAVRFAEVSKRTKQIQDQLWSEEFSLSQSDRSAVAASYMAALNETIALHERSVASLLPLLSVGWDHRTRSVFSKHFSPVISPVRTPA